jgi:hypothetical protein
VRVVIDDARCDDLDFAAGVTTRLIARTMPQHQTVRIAFESKSMGKITNEEDPPCSLNLRIRSIGYPPSDDLAARLNLLEALNARVCDVHTSAAPHVAGADGGKVHNEAVRQ